jgi:hypothetical protein
MKDLCFTSVAFGEQYIAQQDRLKESILKIYPDANILFWRGELPPGSKPFLESLYGFKVHAIAEAKKTFSKVLWLDPAMILMDEVDTALKERDVAVVKDDNILIGTIGDKALDYFCIPKSEVEENKLHLVGGSLYYFNFDWQNAEDVFDMWYGSEHDGIFGSQFEAASEQINGHRNDESCMAISLYINMVEPVSGPEIGYCVEKNPTFKKLHFK